MTQYRGKHSRLNEDISKTNRFPRVSRQQSDTSSTKRFAPIKSHKSELNASHARLTAPNTRLAAPNTRLAAPNTRLAAPTAKRSRRRASPHAFKHHEAVNETGARPRHSKLKTLLIVVPIALVLFGLGALGVFVVSPLLVEEEIVPGVAVTVVIPGDVTTASQIATILKEAHVINDVQAFIADCRSMGAEGLLKVGTYELETLMDTTLLINYLVAGPVTNGVRLTIPEGLTVEQTAALVENVCGIKQADFLKRAYSADEYVKTYPFLAGAYNNSLEGFLYPKTYSIPNGSSADYVIRVLLDQFAFETKNVDISYAESCNMDFFCVITMASLIEKETAADKERALVSSVIYNRMRAGMMLQIDATVVYAMGPGYDGHPVLYSDTEIDSPYNTYQIFELPAGPICSPSIKSIQAAAKPADTDYLYYVLSSREGYHTFCVTPDEFEIAKEEYNILFGIS